MYVRSEVAYIDVFLRVRDVEALRPVGQCLRRVGPGAAPVGFRSTGRRCCGSRWRCGPRRTGSPSVIGSVCRSAVVLPVIPATSDADYHK